MKLINADCIAAMKDMPDNSVDSIVTDPPYELGFMGKSWDSTGIAFNVEVWQQALRVLKPGGHLIAFSGSRTYHRMAVAIEDAGFQIRDQIMWVYGSGFPKSHNISKGIDKANGETDRLIKFTLWMRTTGLKVKDVTQVLLQNNLITPNGTIASHYFAKESSSQPTIPTAELWQKIRPLITEVPKWVDELVQRIEAERKVVGKGSSTLIAESGTYAITNSENANVWKPKEYDITAPATPEAKQWDGWGTALKPAHEPMVLARKPLIGTVANNVLTHGTGGLNIDGCRVGSEEMNKTTSNGIKISENRSMSGANFEREIIGTTTGRFPANFIHDGSDEVLALFPETGKSTTGKRQPHGKQNTFAYGDYQAMPDRVSGYDDNGGSAARFFYCAKTSKRDRNEGLEGFEVKEKRYMATANGTGETSKGMDRFTTQPIANHHPTVKPTDLMRYLCRLITPPNGTVLDPFMGSGSTGKAAILEGFDFIGIEQDAAYIEIAKARIAYVQS